MARYWIRNRGRVQGPFSEERIQGLLRRGRFSRHFHVSEDRKNWYPASDFPELFAGAGGPEPAADDSPFQSGGSPFDDDYDDAPPARLPASERRRGSSKRAAVADDDDDEDDDDKEDEDWEDDEEWEDDDSDGVLTGFINWIEANTKLLVVVLLLVLVGLSWFVFLREDFTQDLADYETLMSIQSRVVQAHQAGARADEWIAMLEATEGELAPMVNRLKDKASSMDMVKQELLFLARDDIPRMFKELPQGKQDASNLVMIRFRVIDQMIKSETRFHDGSAFRAAQRPQAPPAPPQSQPAGQTSPSTDGAVPAGTPSGTTGQPSGSPTPGQNPAPGPPQPGLQPVP